MTSANNHIFGNELLASETINTPGVPRIESYLANKQGCTCGKKRSTQLADTKKSLCGQCEAALCATLASLVDSAVIACDSLVPSKSASHANEYISKSTIAGAPLNLAALHIRDAIIQFFADLIITCASALHTAPPSSLRSGSSAAGLYTNSSGELAKQLDNWVNWLKSDWGKIVALDCMPQFKNRAAKLHRQAQAKFSSATNWVRPAQRYCPVCARQTVTTVWRIGMEPEVYCGSCGWVFELDWREIVKTIGF